MSKSKKNTVAPEDIFDQYGADAGRLFVMSDSPPERDVQWTSGGVEGAWRFIHRVWGEFEAQPKGPHEGDPTSDAKATALLKATHKTIKAVTDSIEGFGFNSGVARLYEFLHALKAAPAEGATPAVLAARAEALSALARLIAPFVPHLAEESWQSLGGDGLVALAPWPEFDPALASDDEVTLPVQINGKRRDEIVVAKGEDKSSVEEKARANSTVQAYLASNNLTINKVIVVPDRIVNIVAS
jgi:leucyl-tRNA synthetase